MQEWDQVGQCIVHMPTFVLQQRHFVQAMIVQWPMARLVVLGGACIALQGQVMLATRIVQRGGLQQGHGTFPGMRGRCAKVGKVGMLD